jgi:multiple sugar transport system permease protein
VSPITTAAIRGGAQAGWRWALFSPALLLMLLLGVLPVLNLAAMSLHSITWKNASAAWQFVGLANYPPIAQDPLVTAGLRNTIIFSLCSVCIQLVIAFFLALWCSHVKRGRTLYRMVFILPLLVPGIVVGAIWKLFLNPDFGFMNELLGLVGIDPLDWLGDSRTALLSVVMVDVWHWTPFCFLLLLAGIEGLPQDIFESARVDGARPLQQLAWITLPLMLPVIAVTAVFRFIVAFKVFDEVYLLTGGGPGTSTEVISFTIYQRFFTEDRAGYGAALSVAVIFLVCLMLVLALGARARFARAA